MLQDELSRLSVERGLPENPKEYYRMWLRILEGHYITLFKSPEYAQCLSKTLNAVQDFSTAKQQVLADLLKTLTIPSQQEMDELYKEIYLLKKRIKTLERQMKN